MAELGSVFEDPGEGPRGPDLRVSVEVPRAALGASLRAPVPRRIAAEGELVERVTVPGQDPDSVELHLPEELPARTMLRLRGQGGRPPEPKEGEDEGEGQAGDLMVVVELVDRPPRDDEIITRSPTALAQRGDAELATTDGRDMTLWLLLALALIGGGVVALFAL